MIFSQSDHYSVQVSKWEPAKIKCSAWLRNQKRGDNYVTDNGRVMILVCDTPSTIGQHVFAII